MNHKEIENRVAELMKRLATERLPLNEFESICREANILRIKREIHRPKHYTAKDNQTVMHRLSYPKTAIPQA